MMLKQPDITGINPVSRVMPVLVVESIGSTAQELGDRATQFVKGQEYFARVLSNVGGTTFAVKVDGLGLKGTDIKAIDPKATDSQTTDTKTIDTKSTDVKSSNLNNTNLKSTDNKGSSPTDVLLKMDLGASAKTGQTISLRYIHSDPVPTFLLTPAPTNVAGSTADISAAASLIGNYLKQAESDGVSTRLQATAVVTHAPGNAQAMAQDLKHAVSSSGLFYESHLSELLQSNQTLVAIKQEPQNQNGSNLAALMSQQLAVLENQRMSWHGEVWPGQNMNWDVYLQPRDVIDDDGTWSSNTSQVDEDRPISSEMTLHLPHLGTVFAKLTLIDGRMRINIQADQLETLDALKNQRQSLAEAIVKNGQQLDALTVVQNE
jgi:hypothetical protein